MTQLIESQWKCVFIEIQWTLNPGGGHWPIKGGMGMCGPEDPLFTPLLLLARVPFQAKESVHKTPFWENLEILASTASIFTQILAHKPPNLEIFSSQAPKFGNFPLTSPQIWKFSAHKPPFSEANVSSQAPHFGNPGRTPLPEKKLSAPPPGHWMAMKTCHIQYENPVVRECTISVLSNPSSNRCSPTFFASGLPDCVQVLIWFCCSEKCVFFLCERYCTL